MLIERLSILAGLAAATVLLASPANALSMAECSTKYDAAKEAGTLDGRTWNQFRKAECGSDASAATETKTPKKQTSNTAKSDEESTGLSMAECSTKYQAAKSAGTLNGMKWNDFRKAECGAGASVEQAKATAPDSAKSDTSGGGLSVAECSTKYQAAKSAGTLNGMKWNDFRKAQCGAGASASVEQAKATAPDSAKSDTSGGGVSMAECSDKYQAAKSAGTLNGMKWNDFRKAECGAGASVEQAKATAPDSAKSDTSGGGLSMAECSTKYQAAKSAGTLNGMKWNDFRKAQCGAGAADDDTVPSVDEAKYNGDPETPKTKAPRGVKFPAAISKKFTDENPGKARMHTCLEQYYANKDANTLGGLRWIQKGGGYYSLCNARLKS